MMWAKVGKGGQEQIPEAGGGGQKSTPIGGFCPPRSGASMPKGKIVLSPEGQNSNLAQDWTDDRIAQLRRLWAEGHTASRIAVTMGGLTRNAVIGKVRRLGLEKRKSPARQVNVGHLRKPYVRVAPCIPAPLLSAIPLPAEPPVPQTALRLTLLQLTDKTCKCGLGDPKDADFAFCGLPVKEGSPYCPTHHAGMYSTVRTENAKIKAKKQKPRKSQHSFDDWRYAA